MISPFTYNNRATKGQYGAALGTPAENSFRYATNIWERTLTGDATIRIQADFSQLNDNILGQTQSFTQEASYSEGRQALNKEIQSVYDQDSALIHSF